MILQVFPVLTPQARASEMIRALVDPRPSQLPASTTCPLATRYTTPLHGYNLLVWFLVVARNLNFPTGNDWLGRYLTPVSCRVNVPS